MNKNIIAGIFIIMGVICLMAASGFGGYYYCDSENANEVARLNKQIYALGVFVQNETNAKAETNRKLKIANRGRIDAIKLNDHNTNEITRLQNVLDKSVRELAETRADNSHFIILNVDTVNRVYNDARNACYGLPDSNDSPIVSARISEFTGDSVTAVVRYAVARYCEVATDYNSLYADTERLLAQ